MKSPGLTIFIARVLQKWKRGSKVPYAIAVLVTFAGCGVVSAQIPNKSMGPLLDGVPLLTRPGGTKLIKPIFFATDRQIDFEALKNAKGGGVMLGSEDYFLNRFDPMLKYGYVEVRCQRAVSRRPG